MKNLNNRADIENDLIVLVQSIEQPRVINTIIEKSFSYKKIYVYAFKRNLHSVSNFDVLKKYDNVEIKIVGTIQDGNYLSRFPKYINLIWLIYYKFGLANKRIITTGLDLRIASVFIINSQIEYVITDIFWLYTSGFKKKISRNIDLFLAKNSSKVIFSSLEFYNKFYSKHVKKENVVVKENKLATRNIVKPINSIKTDCIRISHIGALRYTDIINNLICVAKKNKKLIINFYGDGESEVLNSIKTSALENENIFFHGAFKNPDDLEGMYQQNNLNFVVYDNRFENERIAMPNKFYESGFFNIPIVAAKETYVGQRVLDQNMGWTCGISLEEISEFLNGLEINDIIQTHEHIKTLDKSMFEA